ncbi:MAG: hypothetical protein AAB403_24805 [Planctomycetota bacterium]
MKRYVLMSLLLASMFACPAVLSKEFVPEDIEAQMAMREREMELQQREAKMSMDREMQKLELEGQRLKLDRAREGHKREPHPLLLLVVVVHILLAVWVYMDIRQLNRGSGLWIVLVLLAGLLAAVVYAIVRLGDSRQAKS